MTDASYFEILEAISQFLIAIVLIRISDTLALLCRILCGNRCRMGESDEND